MSFVQIFAGEKQVAAFVLCAVSGFFAVQGHAVFVVIHAVVMAFALFAVAGAGEACAGVRVHGVVLVQG